MIYAAMVEVVVYYYIFIYYYQTLFPSKENKRVQTILALFSIAATYTILGLLDIRWLNIPFAALTMITGIRFSTGMNWLQSVHGGSTCILSIYSIRGIFTAIYALIHMKSDRYILFNYSFYYTITVFVLPISFLFILIMHRTIFTDGKLKRLLNDSKQLKFVVAYEITAILNFLTINYGRFLPADTLWYIGITLGASILTIGMLIYSMHHSIRASELTEYEFRNKMLEEQYTRQLRHYNSYQKYTESFRTFRHDYKVMMVSLKSLIHECENDKAIQLIDSIYDTMEKKVHVHKKYSDNVILDALMQDLANICEENNIRFSFVTTSPKNTKLSVLDSLRIFHNVTQNAFEACCKIPESERFIEISSWKEHGWITLKVVNSFNGEKVVQDENFVTTKKDNDMHGLGLSIIKEIAENAGGFITIDADCESKIFIICVHVPEVYTNIESTAYDSIL